MVGVMQVYGALLQIPGVDVVELTFSEQISTNWDGMGFMRWPLAACLLVGIILEVRGFSVGRTLLLGGVSFIGAFVLSAVSCAVDQSADHCTL